MNTSKNIKRISEIEVNEWSVRIVIDSTLINIYFDDSDIAFAKILVNGQLMPKDNLFLKRSHKKAEDI